MALVDAAISLPHLFYILILLHSSNSCEFKQIYECIGLYPPVPYSDTPNGGSADTVVDRSVYVDTGIPLALDPVGEPTGKHPHPRLD